MSRFQSLLDENVDASLGAAARRGLPEVTVWTIGDPGAPPRGTLDPEILNWCETHGFILLTNNRASMPMHLEEHLTRGRHVPGIFILNPRLSLGEVIAELDLICNASEPHEYRDALHYLPISR